MFIWIIAILLLLVWGALGFFTGALAMLITLAGFLVALLASKALAPLMESLYLKMEFSNLIALKMLPPITAFLLVSLIFLIIGLVVHWKLSSRFKFAMDEVTRLRWTRMNQHCGAAIGLFMGSAYTVLVGMLVYVMGYFSLQVASSNDQGWISRLNAVASGLEGSGMAKIARSICPAPETFFKVSDLLAFSRANPLLEVRYRNYPPFLKLSDDKMIQDIAADEGFNNLWTQQAALGEFMANPICQQVMTDQGFVDRMLAYDLEDLDAYLHTGESPAHKDESILGRWEFDANATINHFMRNTVGVTGKQIREFKAAAYGTDGGLTLVAHPDQKITIQADAKTFLKNVMRMGIMKVYKIDSETAEAYVTQFMDGGGDQGNDDGYGDPYGGMNQGDYEMQQRYGLSPGAMSQQQGPSSDQISDFMEQMQKGFEDYFSNLDLQWKRVGRGRYEASGGQITIKKDYRLSLEAKNTFAGAQGGLLGDGSVMVFKRVW